MPLSLQPSFPQHFDSRYEDNLQTFKAMKYRAISSGVYRPVELVLSLLLVQS